MTSSLIAQYNQRPVLLTDEATLLADHKIDASTAQETAGKDTIFDTAALLLANIVLMFNLLCSYHNQY